MKDDKKLKSKIAHSLKVMAMAKSRISKLTNEMNDENCSKVKDELAELEQFIKPGIQLIKEDSSLD